MSFETVNDKVENFNAQTMRMIKNVGGTVRNIVIVVVAIAISGWALSKWTCGGNSRGSGGGSGSGKGEGNNTEVFSETGSETQSSSETPRTSTKKAQGLSDAQIKLMERDKEFDELIILRVTDTAEYNRRIRAMNPGEKKAFDAHKVKRK